MKLSPSHSWRAVAAGLAASVALVAGVFVAPPAMAAPDEAPTLAALDNLGLLSGETVAARSASSSLTSEILRVDSASGSISISPVTGTEGSLSADAGVAVFAGDTNAATYALTSKDAGAAENAGYVILHDAGAPTRHEFRIMANDQPAELSLVDGRVLVSDQNGEAVNIIGTAWAKDADGAPVSTWYEVDGDLLIQHIEPSQTSIFPVVADPRVACDAVWCTIEFTRTETQTASETAAGASAVLCGGAALLNPIVGFVCGAYGATFWVAAVQAKNTGQCAGFRMLTIGGSAHPVIIPCYA